MFDDDVEYGDAIAHVFDTDHLPSIADDLRRTGGTVANGSCPVCGGVLYDHEHEVVCSRCSLVVGSSIASESQSPWDYFRDNRPDYYHSNKSRCVGGFPDSYDWVEREDLDRPVKKIDPELFYE